MILKHPRVLILALILIVAASLALWSARRASTADVPQPVETPSMDEAMRAIQQREREIAAHLNSFRPETVTREKMSILEELRAELACRIPRSVCKTRPTDAVLFDRLEKLEALIRLDEVPDPKAAGDLLLVVLRVSPGHAAMAASMLAELPDGQALLKAFELSGLDPVAKAQLISAALDPADEHLKSRLMERAHAEFERMIEQGSGPEAFAATSLFSQFADMADGELARLGRSLCRFSVDSSQAFLFENLKLKLRREAGSTPKLRGLLSDCKG